MVALVIGLYVYKLGGEPQEEILQKFSNQMGLSWFTMIHESMYIVACQGSGISSKTVSQARQTRHANPLAHSIQFAAHPKVPTQHTWIDTNI